MAYVKMSSWGTIPFLGTVPYAQHKAHNTISVPLLDAAGFTVEIGNGK